MSCLYQFIAECVGAFFANDAQALFVAIFVTGSLCCSLIWRIFAFLSVKNDFGETPVKRKPAKRVKPRRTFDAFNSSHGLFDDFSCPTRLVSAEKHEQPVTPRKPYIPDSLPSVHNCGFLQSHLFHYDKSFSGLSRCPERIGFLGTQLVCLNLSNNSLSTLPDEIGCLLGLEELYLSQNRLHHLPGTLRNLRKLTELDLQSNELTSLAVELTELQSLRQLLVNNNLLTHLPTDIHRLQCLEYLDLSFNRLQWLPDGLCGLFGLRVLNVSSNPLSYLPEKFNRLVRLMHFVANLCQLVVLPRSICGCTQLVTVHLSKNRLQHLPNRIGQLFNLQVLSLDGNRLRYLPVTISSLCGCHILVENNCFVHPLPTSPVVFNIRSGSASATAATPGTALTPRFPSQHIVSLLEQAALCLLQNNIKWQQENIPQILKDTLTNVQYCVKCDRPLLLWHRMQLSSHWLVNKAGHKMHVPIVQSTCPLQKHLNPCSFINL